jgi:4-amino-4-deoxy-L-arabinose transferase-like glycosyltransferase
MLALTRLSQGLLDAGACLLVFLFARNIFGRRVGLIASWAYCILPPTIQLLAVFMPDALTRFLAILIACVASYLRRGGFWPYIAGGAAVGLASHFRPEFLLLPAFLFPAIWADTRRFWRPVAGTAITFVVAVLALSPWVIWTGRVAGKPMLSTTSAGGSMYEALGELPDNPWGIELGDAWLDRDAVSRGFKSAWSVEANAFYTREFKQCVAQHPGYYARMVLWRRLPRALWPAYSIPGDDFSISAAARTREVSAWQIVSERPWHVLWHTMGRALSRACSFVLLAATVLCGVICWRRWRQVAWVILPWAYFIVSICLIKQVEARNMAAVMVYQVVALGLVVTWAIDRRRAKVSSVSSREGAR